MDRDFDIDFEIFMLIMDDYRLDIICPDKSLRYKDRFAESSFKRWAADELEIYVLSHIDDHIMDSINGFRKKINAYKNINPKSSKIFSIAELVADDIYEILYWGSWRDET